MCVVLAWQLDIAHRQLIQLPLQIPSGRIDRQQDRPRNSQAGKANDRQDLQKSEEQVPIQRAIIQDIIIVNLPKRFNPVNPPIWQRRSCMPASHETSLAPNTTTSSRCTMQPFCNLRSCTGCCTCLAQLTFEGETYSGSRNCAIVLGAYVLALIRRNVKKMSKQMAAYTSTGTKVLPRALNDAESLLSPEEWERVPPDAPSRPEPILGSSLSFCCGDERYLS